MVWERGFSHRLLSDYAREVWQVSQRLSVESRFPEWIVQELGQDWMIEFPSMDETGLYFVTIPYVNWLLDRLGLEQGLVLERLAKLCRMLDSAKCSFGVLFSKEGITGERTTTDAAREQVKVFQQRGMVVVVVSDADIRAVAEGLNFITMLRRKYERVRLDLRQKGQS